MGRGGEGVSQGASARGRSGLRVMCPPRLRTGPDPGPDPRPPPPLSQHSHLEPLAPPQCDLSSKVGSCVRGAYPRRPRPRRREAVMSCHVTPRCRLTRDRGGEGGREAGPSTSRDLQAGGGGGRLKKGKRGCRDAERGRGGQAGRQAGPGCGRAPRYAIGRGAPS